MLETIHLVESHHDGSSAGCSVECVGKVVQSDIITIHPVCIRSCQGLACKTFKRIVEIICVRVLEL